MVPLIDPKDRQYYLLGMRIAADFGASIAVPVIVFVFIGQWLDRRLGRNYLFTAAGFIVAALVSGRIIYRKAKVYGKMYEQNINETKRPDRIETPKEQIKQK